jgi:rhodanese-related sulfurtransferase
VSAGQVDEQQLEAPADVFARAAHRGHRMGLHYAGAVTPAEAHQLAEAGAARIVDVRTPEEWRDVGHVDGPALIVWPRDGSAEEVQAFLKKLRERFEPSQPLLFLCRSGVRSHYAAQVAVSAGFKKAYNILEGFEGHPGAGDGWRAAGLPWTV